MATRMRATDKMMRSTRRIDADGCFTEESSDMARALVATGMAEYAPTPTPSAGRPTKAAQRETAQQEAREPELEDYTREELLDMAIRQDVILPQGYIKKDELIKLLRKG